MRAHPKNLGTEVTSSATFLKMIVFGQFLAQGLDFLACRRLPWMTSRLVFHFKCVLKNGPSQIRRRAQTLPWNAYHYELKITKRDDAQRRATRYPKHTFKTLRLDMIPSSDSVTRVPPGLTRNHRLQIPKHKNE